jgi:hypothetical protein
MAMNWSRGFGAMALCALFAGQASAQTVVTSTPPSVDNGVANGIVKHAGAPSVDNGVANGVVKQPGSPSVGDGIANGVVKSSTVNQ